MSKTGGGKGTNGYAVKGVSRASRQSAAVLDDLAAEHPAATTKHITVIDPPRFSQFQEHDCHICGHESLRRPVWINRGEGPEPVGAGCLSTLMGVPVRHLTDERDTRAQASEARRKAVEERVQRYRLALYEYDSWEEERAHDKSTPHIVQRDLSKSDFNRLRHEWATRDPSLLPPAAFSQWLREQIATLDAQDA